MNTARKVRLNSQFYALAADIYFYSGDIGTCLKYIDEARILQPDSLLFYRKKYYYLRYSNTASSDSLTQILNNIIEQAVKLNDLYELSAVYGLAAELADAFGDKNSSRDHIDSAITFINEFLVHDPNSSKAATLLSTLKNKQQIAELEKSIAIIPVADKGGFTAVASVFFFIGAIYNLINFIILVYLYWDATINGNIEPLEKIGSFANNNESPASSFVICLSFCLASLFIAIILARQATKRTRQLKKAQKIQEQIEKLKEQEQSV